MTPKQQRRRSRSLPIILSAVAVSGLGAGVYAVMRVVMNSKPAQPKQVVQQIQLIRPPPPPPDVPPPPPPPPEEKVDVSEPDKQPDPTPSNDPPPSQQLGLDAEGTAGGDAFGLVGNKGGRDFLAGGSGSAFAWYAGLVKNEISEQLGNAKQARNGQYSMTVRVWVRGDGTIERVSIVQSSGNPERDRAIEAALSRMTRLPQAPPPDMPQPISLRIESRA